MSWEILGSLSLWTLAAASGEENIFVEGDTG